MTGSAKSWELLQLECDQETADIISAFFEGYSLGAVNDESTHSYFFESDNKSLIEKIISDIAGDFNLTWQWTHQEQEPWHLAWKDNFKPVNISESMRVIPDWSEEEDTDSTIRIRPGMAFGTGHHETTYLMLEFLQEYLQEGMTVLDIGSGSGILAIGASKKGAGQILCLEVDPDCRENFNENLDLNGITGGVDLQITDVLEWKEFSQDMILANVNQKIITRLVPLLKDASGIIALSGLLKADKDNILALCRKNELEVLHVHEMGEWIRVVLNPSSKNKKFQKQG